MSGINTKTMCNAISVLAVLGLAGCGVQGNLQGSGATELAPTLQPTGDATGDPSGPGDNDPAQDTATVRGFVQDPDGEGIAGVRVFDWDGWETVTDEDGRYEMPDVPDGTLVRLIFSKKGYAGSYGSFNVMAAGENFFRQILAPVDLETVFHSDDGIAFTIDETHDFLVPGGTMFTQSGDPYTGSVDLNATVWDRRKMVEDSDEFLASPGRGTGINADGDRVLLWTLGMFQLEFRGDEGQPLEPGPGFEMRVDVPPSLGLQEGDVVPYWNYDPFTREWIEDQIGIVTDTFGEAAWEFIPGDQLPSGKKTGWIVGNPDVPRVIFVSGFAEGVVTTPQGNPKPNVPVRVIAADQTFMSAGQTDADGRFKLQVPPVVPNPAGPNGRPMFIEVDYEVAEKPSIWRQNPQPPPAPQATQDWGTFAVGSQTCLSGNVLDPSGSPVAGVNVLNPHGGMTMTDDDGAFCMSVPKYQPATIYTAPELNAELGFEPQRTRPVEAPDGACDASCPNRITLRAYPATQCVKGEVTVGGVPADAIAVDSFDARYPGTAVFSTLSDAGQYCVTVPADLPAVVRAGVGDNTAGNACGRGEVLAPRDDYATCDSGWCLEGPLFECGE